MLEPLLDIFRLKQYFGAVTVARDLVAGAAEDVGFVFDVRRALLPLPWEDRGPRPAVRSPFPAPVATAPPAALDRVAIACTGGSGALASVVGVARAFEERGLTPVAISACSGSGFFAFPLGAGIPAEEVASFLLSLRPRDYLDLDVPGLASMPLRAARGFTGLLRGDAVEERFRALLGDLRLRDLVIPVHAPIWEVDGNRVAYVGPATHPDLPVARAVRMSIALSPLFQAVALDGTWWCDGGIVDIFPVRPLLEQVRPEAVVAVNGFFPPEFAGEDARGWHERSLSLLYAGAQVRTVQMAELARENLARLRAQCRVEMTEPVPYAKVRGLGFYRQFLDTAEWPEFMRAGHLSGLRALDALATGSPNGSLTRRSPAPPARTPGATGT